MHPPDTSVQDVIFNGVAYSKAELAPDAAVLGLYSICENDKVTYIKLAIGAGDSAEFWIEPSTANRFLLFSGRDLFILFAV